MCWIDFRPYDSTGRLNPDSLYISVSDFLLIERHLYLEDAPLYKSLDTYVWVAEGDKRVNLQMSSTLPQSFYVERGIEGLLFRPADYYVRKAQVVVTSHSNGDREILMGRVITIGFNSP